MEIAGSHESRRERGSHSPWKLPVVFALLITLLSVVAHVTSPSTLHQSEQSWAERIELHETSPIFSKRPLTSIAVVALHDSLGLGYRASFFALQFALMTAALICFWYWLSILGFGRGEGLAGMVIFGLSHSVFLAHFEPIHTWSDFWVYALIPLSLAWSLKKRYIPAVIAAVLALIARETSLLFVPLMIPALRLGGSRRWPASLAGAAVIILFVGERLYFHPHLSAIPDFKLLFNFDGLLRTSDTIFSVIVSLGFVWITGLLGLVSNSGFESDRLRFLKWGGIWTVVGFTASSLLFGQVRESRLFVPTMVFLIPLTIVWWRSRRPAFRQLTGATPKWGQSAVALVLVALGIGLATVIFPEFEYRAWRDGSWVWLGLNIAAAGVVITVERKWKRMHNQSLGG